MLCYSKVLKNLEQGSLTPSNSPLSGGEQNGSSPYSPPDKTTSHSTKISKNDSQVAGYDKGSPGGVAFPQSCPSSSSGSAMRLKPASFSPFSTFISVTPCAVRPKLRISLTPAPINTPLVPISMISSSTFTSVAATTLPLRGEVLIAIMPCVPRPWRVYSTIGLRLP